MREYIKVSAWMRLAPVLLYGAEIFAQPPSHEGLVVVTAAPDSASASAGLKPGDRIASWSRGSLTGRFANPYDVNVVEVEQAPLGPIEIAGYRGPQAMVWKLGQESWQLTCRPTLPGDLSGLYEAGSASSLTGAADRERQSDPIGNNILDGQRFLV